QAAELEGFDEVVMATGVEPRLPDIAGIEEGQVIGYADLLSGKAEPGERIAIIGAGGIGVDVALYLTGRQSRSTLDPIAFREAWGVSDDPRISGGLASG